MNGSQRTKIMTALLAAYEYGVLAGGASDGSERVKNDKLMLNRLQHAVENAGFEMGAKVPQKAAA